MSRMNAICAANTVIEMLGMNILEATHPDDREITLQLYDEIRMGRRQVVDYEKRYLCKDGSVIWGHATAAGVFGSDGALRYFAANVQDITDSKRAQDQLQESKQMLQLVIDYIPQHVFWKDRDSVYIGCNRNFARAAGVESPQNIIGKTDYDLAWKREEADFYRECDRRVMEADMPELHIIAPQLQARVVEDELVSRRAAAACSRLSGTAISFRLAWGSASV